MNDFGKGLTVQIVEKEWPLAILAHNEEKNILYCLESLAADEDFKRLNIFILANACTDRTIEIAKGFSANFTNLQVIDIAMGDRGNAWNVFVHKYAPPAKVYFFMDADCAICPKAFSYLAQALQENQQANAAGALPASGRSRKKIIRYLKQDRLFMGNLYALRGSFIEEFRKQGVYLPMGLTRDDGFLGALVKWDLAPEKNFWNSEKVVVAEQAKFCFKPLSPLSLRYYWRRLIRYATGDFQTVMLRDLLTAGGIKAMPGDIKELYLNFDLKKLKIRRISHWFALNRIKKIRIENLKNSQKHGGVDIMKQPAERILMLTCTYNRHKRIRCIKRLIGILKNIKNILWILVEDAEKIDPEVNRLVNESRIPHVYLNVGPTREWGNAQKDLGLRYIRDNSLEGIVYIADDDNYYEEELFTEIRKTKKVSIFPVGNLGPHGIEKPIIKDGKIIGWDADWKERKFPVDMAGFAFNAQLLKNLSDPIWKVTPSVERGGETEFLEKIIKSSDEFEPLCDNCKNCFVYHDLPLGQCVAFTMVIRKIKIFIKYILLLFKIKRHY